MKRWWFSLIVVFLLLGLPGYYYFSKYPTPLDIETILTRHDRPSGASARKDQPAPEEILALRQRHRLRPLTEGENGTRVRDLAHGTYGYGSCDPQTVTATRTNGSSLEIQKHVDGIVYYVGYAPEEHVEKYFSRQKNFHILLSSEPRGRASLAFEIPIDFVSKCTMSTLRDGPVYDLFVAAIPELQS